MEDELRIEYGTIYLTTCEILPYDVGTRVVYVNCRRYENRDHSDDYYFTLADRYKKGGDTIDHPDFSLYDWQIKTQLETVQERRKRIIKQLLK